MRARGLITTVSLALCALTASACLTRTLDQRGFTAEANAICERMRQEQQRASAIPPSTLSGQKEEQRARAALVSAATIHQTAESRLRALNLDEALGKVRDHLVLLLSVGRTEFDGAIEALDAKDNATYQRHVDAGSEAISAFKQESANLGLAQCARAG